MHYLHLISRFFAKCGILLLIVSFTQAHSVFADAAHCIDLSSKAGIVWQFKPEGGSWVPITVPGGGWRAQGLTCDAGTYQTTIAIPLYAAGGDVKLIFSAINFGAKVFVGSSLDSLTQVASHVDGWLPVTADITQYAIPGKQLMLEVEVQGRKKFMVNGKYTVPEGATWSPYLEEGILRGTTLDILPQVHVDSATVQTVIGPDRVSGLVVVSNTSKSTKSITVNASVTSDTGSLTSIKWPVTSINLSAGEVKNVQLPAMSWSLGPKSYWWPNVPYKRGYRTRMYALAVEIVSGSDAKSTFSQPFGFRQFCARGNHYYLNGVRCNLRGDNLQEANFGTDAYGIRPGFGPPTKGNGGWPEAVDNLQRLNFNVMRIHQIPATPYMLDVCDRMGLMLVDESPLRGSEGGEDYAAGKDNMLNMDRELVTRDINHPSVVIWSAANEWSDPIPDAVKAILAIDASRPVIADGAVAAAPVIDTGHYLTGFSVLPRNGAAKRDDRPYGETEDIWPADNTLQGFAWMGTGIRLRRLNGDADLRNYTLNNAWPNFVPGEGPDNEVLEWKIKGNPDATILPAIHDPWNNPNIQLIQNCYNPVAIADLGFDLANANSNAKGEWPVKIPKIAAGMLCKRTIAVFNDEFSGEVVNVAWKATEGAPDGKLIAWGAQNYDIPLGDFRKIDISFLSPAQIGQKVCLAIETLKNGVECCVENKIAFLTGDLNKPDVPAGDYLIQNQLSGLYLAVASDGKSLVQQEITAQQQVWKLIYKDANTIILVNKTTGMTINSGGINAGNSDPIYLLAASNPPSTWKMEPASDGYVLASSLSGRVMDDYQLSRNNQAPVVLYDENGGENQHWAFIKAK